MSDPDPSSPTRRPSGDYRYSFDGEVFRVVVAGDVIALPNEEWSYAGFGSSISEEWLLGSGNVQRFPGRSKGRKRLLAYFVRRALADHHGYRLPVSAWADLGYLEGAPMVTR